MAYPRAARPVDNGCLLLPFGQDGTMPTDDTLTKALMRLPSVFPASQARELGLTRRQLQGRHFVCVARGVFALADAQPDHLDLLRAFCPGTADEFVSHSSAARAWGLWLPPQLSGILPVHLSRLGPETAVLRNRNVRGHRSQATRADLRVVDGIRLVSPEWCWTELAGLGLDVEQLVAAGDALLQRADGPQRPSGVVGRNPLTTRDRIEDVLVRRPTFRGRKGARRALGMIREGVDSPMESLVRLRIVRRGWPEPAVNPRIEVAPGRFVRPDLAFPDFRIAVQYEGAHHRDGPQMTKDIRRDHALEAIDWITVRADGAILTARGEAEFFERLRLAFVRRGARLPSTA
ncbi:hypothetical protein GCM10022377_08590 [Zhihengliuella alba]|uniref:Transcriptional regulator, AbiEi antitoxin, Type IV TA system n=1 Tax=Zhihengliuella alba TaxID=547018 RepID=A0ABP7D1H1_9MICC